MPWGIGGWYTALYDLGGKGELINEVFINSDEVREVIKKYPWVIPYISPRHKCFVFENVRVEDSVIDLVIAEIQKKRRSRPIIYLVFLNWFVYGSNIDFAGSFEEAYSEIGRELEYIDELVTFIKFLSQYKSKWAHQLRSRLKRVLGVRRLGIDDVYALVVVDELTNEFIMIMNAVNEITDAYIDTLEIRKFRACGGREILLTRLYTWRDLLNFTE